MHASRLVLTVLTQGVTTGWQQLWYQRSVFLIEKLGSSADVASLASYKKREPEGSNAVHLSEVSGIFV